MTLIIIGICALVALHFSGYLHLTYTGLGKPLCQVSLFGLNISIQKPKLPPEPTEPTHE